LITSDDCVTYPEVLLKQYGEKARCASNGCGCAGGCPRCSDTRWPSKSAYATVNKTYAKGSVSAIERTLVHGTTEDLASAMTASRSSTTVNTSFVERQNGTDRTYNARKARKTYQFSKDLLVHVAVTWWVFFCYNFHHSHRSLRIRNADRTYLHRTPAVAIGIAKAPLSIMDILTTQVVGLPSLSKPTLADFRRSAES
jgi:hypothetical protein